MKASRRSIFTMLVLAAFLLSGIPAAASAEPAAEAVVLSDGETLTVTEDMVIPSLTIGEGCAVQPGEGYRLIMTAEGAVTRPAPGQYRDVTFTLQPEDFTYGAYDETGNAEGAAYRFLFNKGGDRDVFVKAAFDDAVTVTEEDGFTVLDGGGSAVTVNDDRINALSAEASDVIIRNIAVDVDGLGLCEYGNAFGAAISVAGDSSVIIRNVDVTTVGAIMSTLNSAEGDVLVMDSRFHGYGTAEDASGLHSGLESYSNIQGSLTEVPWVLGLKGTLRATNVIGSANVLYYNDSASSNGWGVYSTDGGKSFIILNSDAAYDDSQGAAFNSLYGAYVLGLPTYFYGFDVDLTGARENTYGIVARHGFTMGASSQENLEALDKLITEPETEEEEDGGDASGEASAEAGIESAAGVWALFRDNVELSEVEERRSSVRAMYGIMSHGASGGVFDITDTDITADRAAFLLKEAYMDIRLDGSVNIDAPIIIHQQITDDASMGEYAYDHCWATATAPFLYEVEDRGETPAKGASAAMTGMTLEGDFYNTDTNGAYLDLTFEDTEVSGVISSATFLHNNASYYVVENPAFDPDGEDNGDNPRYICVDGDGRAYETDVTHTLFGGTVYNPVYEDDDGIVTFAYDPAGTEYDPADIVGYCIFYTDAQYCSDGVITPCAAVNDPVYVTLSGGSVWNVTGESYLARLTVEEGCAINGSVTVDGETVDVSAGGEWEGDIRILPAGDGLISMVKQDGEIYMSLDDLISALGG